MLIYIGLLEWNEKERVLKPKRGKKVALRISNSAKSSLIRQKAEEKWKAYYSNFYDENQTYLLLYEDGQKVLFLPGTSELFTLKRYQEEVGKDYNRIYLYLCTNEDYDNTLMGADDSDDDSMPCFPKCSKLESDPVVTITIPEEQIKLDEQIARGLDNELNQVVEVAVVGWFHSNFLILNVNKTKIMLIGTYQRLSAADGFSIRADNTDLDRVYAFKYLGVLMDQTLSWKDHIDSLGKKISSRLGMLRRARKVLPKGTCVTLYNTMVLPLFDYCAAVWDGCGVGYKGYLDKLNRRAACIIEGRSVAADELFTVFSWPNLQARRDYLKCVLVYKSLRQLIC